VTLKLNDVWFTLLCGIIDFTQKENKNYCDIQKMTDLKLPSIGLKHNVQYQSKYILSSNCIDIIYCTWWTFDITTATVNHKSSFKSGCVDRYTKMFSVWTFDITIATVNHKPIFRSDWIYRYTKMYSVWSGSTVHICGHWITKGTRIQWLQITRTIACALCCDERF